jgi:hypothetical protein
MRISILLALLLTSLALNAAQPRIPEDALRGQNAQYQQGFRDGFREAIRLMEGGAGTQDGGGLRIESATYGSERRSCNFTRRLGEQANGKREFDFRANNSWCGDPDRGADKSAKIHYSCGRDRRTIQVPEDKSAKLRCN